MAKSFHIKAHRDDDAGVWVSRSDVDGLHVEAATLDEFRAIVADMAPAVIAANHGCEAVALVELA